jgi:hypothetical protein
MKYKLLLEMTLIDEGKEPVLLPPGSVLDTDTIKATLDIEWLIATGAIEEVK